MISGCFLGEVRYDMMSLTNPCAAHNVFILSIYSSLLYYGDSLSLTTVTKYILTARVLSACPSVYVCHIMARPVSTLNDQLTCSVCLERYKEPKTLPCHHSFCRVCLERVPALEKVDVDEQHEAETAEQLVSCIKCPNCRKSVPLPSGGVSELPPAFLINNLLEVQKTTEFENVQPRTECAGHGQYNTRTENAASLALLCEKHDRVLEFYCNDCDVLLCSVCSIKFHRAHDCDLAADITKAHRKLIEDQLALLRRDVTHVDSMIAYVDSAKERVFSEGDVTKKAITDAVEQLHRHIEDRKTTLMAMLNQNIGEKLHVLKNHREKGLAMATHMRKSESIVECKLERLKDSIEIIAVKNELVQLISELRLNPEALKFTPPCKISFSSNPPNSEIGFLFEPAEKHDSKEIVVGKKCRYMLYLLGAGQTDIVCHLVPSNSTKPSECQVNGKGK